MRAPFRFLATGLACMAGTLTAGESAAQMQLGATIVDTVNVHSAAAGGRGAKATGLPDGVVTRCTVIRVGDGGVAYDGDLARFVGAWSGGFVEWAIVRKDRQVTPAKTATRLVTGKLAAGFAAAGASLADPRPKPWGPLPATQARLKGRHLHGDQVVLAWSVGGAQLLESPAPAGSGANAGVARRFTAAAGVGPLRMQVCGDADKPATPAGLPAGAVAAEGANGVLCVGLSNAPAGARLAIADGMVVLDLPKLSAPTSFAAVIARLPAAGVGGFAALLSAPAVDLAPLSKGGGPKRWGAPAQTTGTVGKDTGFGMAQDELVPPNDNPWNSPMRFTGLDFFADGRAAVCTWDGDVLIVDGIDESLAKLRWTRFATGLFQPCGLRIAGEQVHVSCKDGIIKLHDQDNDGEADFLENFNCDNGVAWSGHQWGMALDTDPEGNFYYAVGGHRWTVTDELGHHCCTLKVSKDGSKLEIFANGYRETAGMSVGPDGTVYAADNPGGPPAHTPLDIIVKGGVYGYARDWAKLPAFLWFPHSYDGSAGGQAWIPAKGWGGMPAGTFMHFSYSKSAMFVGLPDRNAPKTQAAAVAVPMPFASGTLRPRFNPKDGQLYVAGLKGWDTNAARPGCLTRVRASGAPWRLPTGYSVQAKGIRLHFAAPLDKSAADAGNWSFVANDWTKGGPKAAGKTGSPWTLSGMKLTDPTTLDLEFSDFRPIDCLEIKAKLKSADGGDVAMTVLATVNAVK